MNKALPIIIVIFLLGIIACSDSKGGIDHSDSLSTDIKIVDDTLQVDSSTEITDIDGTDSTPADSSSDGYTDVLVDVNTMLDAESDIQLFDTVEDSALDSEPVDTAGDISPIDSISDTIDAAGIDATEISDIEDIGNTIPPPKLILMTTTPSLETTIKIGGTATAGENIFIFKNKNCSQKADTILSTTEFNQSGADFIVSAGSTTYFSAYVNKGSNYSPCSNFVTYVHHNNAYWYISFFDDFKGMQSGEDPDCYSMPPQCIGEYLSGLYECPQSEIHSGLDALNKCNWTILRQPNWMANDYGPNRNGTNGFSPLEVRVEPATDNGVLILSANAYKWDGSKLNTSTLSAPEKNCLSQPQSNWLLHENNSPDCRNIIQYNCVWQNNTVICPIISGAVYSKRFSTYKKGNSTIQKERGFTQEYGRWEVRAKLPYGSGSFPAHWLLPQSGSWPERGEIDIMEADRYARDSYQTYHTGYCEGSPDPYYPDHQECIKNGGQRYHLAQGGRLVYKNNSFANDYHTFSVEWSKDRIDFYTDNIKTLSIRNGDMNYGIFTDYFRTTGKARPLNIPFGEFFIILNQTVHNDSGGNIDLLNFIPHIHIIDYVKVYDSCSSPSDFCKEGFYFDGNDGLCHPMDRSRMIKSYQSPCKLRVDLIPEPQPLDTQKFYNCTTPCPYGGWFDGSNCQIFASPSSREVFFYPDETGNLYYATDGSQNGNCTDTVNGITIPVGNYDGANCYLDKTLPELYGKYFRWGSPKPNAFYYQPFCKFQ
ncbi:MAG: glycoside hydrolase family 16 protein [Myxococcota bacterium]